jgi:acetyl esterase
MLDHQAQALLQFLKDKGAPTLNNLGAQQARQAYSGRLDLTQPPPPQIGLAQDHIARGTSTSIRLREYQPCTPPGAGKRAALLYLHGGGWTVGDIDSHDVLCRSLCEQANCTVVSVDYRLGPEHRFPAAFDDTLLAYQWVVDQAEALGIDVNRIAIGGDSAGGNLAAAACLALRDHAFKPVFQLLIYPATDLNCNSPSHTTNGQGYLLTRELILWFVENYLVQTSDANDWRASPLLAPSLAGAAPALVLTAGYDPLRDEGLLYADALSKAGVATQYICFERQIHGFITMGRLIDEANTAVSLCAVALRKAFVLA